MCLRTVDTWVQVVVLNSRPTVPDGPGSSQRSAMELSLIIDEADCRRNVAGRGRKSSLLAWETSLEDVLEDEDGEEGEEDGEEESMMEGTVLEARGENEEEWDVTMEEDEKVTLLNLLMSSLMLVFSRLH